MHILGLDVGTSSVKAAVLDVDSVEPVGEIARVGYALDQPTPDAATIPAERLWEAVLAAASQAASGQRQIEGVGFSFFSPGLILLDQRDRPLTPIVTHLDHRSRGEARRIESECGPEFLATTGNRPLPGGISAVSYAYLVRQQPELARRVRRYLHVDGWLGLQFTAEAAFDLGNACFTGLYNTMGPHAWSPRWCQYFGIEPAWLPEARSGDATLGGLRAVVAERLGVPAGIPVKLGTADTSCAMLAARLEVGELLHVVGTTQVLAVRTLHPRPAADHLTRLLGVGDGFVHITHNPVGGVALEWMHALCFHDQTAAEFYKTTIPLAIAHKTDVKLDPPYLGGDRLQIEEQRAAFRDLTIAHERLDLLSAVLVAMQIQHARAAGVLCEGRPLGRVVLTGGGADIAAQAIPEYRGRAIERIDEASLRGVARLFDHTT